MAHPTDLLGRDVLVHDVNEALTAGRSVVLHGPEGIGKTAIVSAIRREGVIVVDPFEQVTRQQAAEIRRALDRGAVYLAAARSAQPHELGAVGRILWRFLPVPVRELPDHVLGRLVVRALAESQGRGSDRMWMVQTLALARGRPGFALGIARFADHWRRRHGYLPMPGFAFAAMREDEAIRMLDRATTTEIHQQNNREHP